MRFHAWFASFVLLTAAACSTESGTGVAGPNGSSPDGSSGGEGSSGGGTSGGPSSGANGAPSLTVDAMDTPTTHTIEKGKESVTIPLAGRGGLPADASGVYVQAVTSYDAACDSASWELLTPDSKAPPRRLFQEGPLATGKNAVWMPLGATQTIVARVPKFACGASVGITVLGWAKGVRLDLEDVAVPYQIAKGKESVTMPLADHPAVPADADAVYVQTVTHYDAACDHADWQLATAGSSAPARLIQEISPFDAGINAVWMPVGPTRELVARVPGFACGASVELTVLGSAKGLAVDLIDMGTTHAIEKGKESVTIPLGDRANVPADATAVYVQAVTQYDAACDGADWELGAADVNAPARKLYQEGPLEVGKNAVWLPLGATKSLVARVPGFKCGATANIKVLGWAKR